jgi:predicted amidophosphoribosyltransferase
MTCLGCNQPIDGNTDLCDRCMGLLRQRVEEAADDYIREGMRLLEKIGVWP